MARSQRALPGGLRGVSACLLLATTGLVVSCGVPDRTLQQIYVDRPQVHALDTSALQGRRILIDPGHGGAFAGSRGLAETREADVNLGVGLYLWGLLRDAGADVHLTRASDRDLLPAGSASVGDDLAQRVALLDSLQPEVFLSLHHNSNAALDRERNAVETYFKLDDEGPSYDLARAVHRALAGSLGIEHATLRPGNYYVLRESSIPSVLGEASYLSHPDVESRLRLAEKQLLEAEAYFLGLLDYFSRGLPQLEWTAADGDSLAPNGVLRIGVRADAQSPVDPLSLRVRLDGSPTTVYYDEAAGTLQVPLHPLAPGRHRIDVRVRNLRGNAATPLRKAFLVWSPPRRLRLRQEPALVSRGSDARLRLEFLGAHDELVADGIPVQITGRGCTVDSLPYRTRDGIVLLRARQVEPRAALHVRSTGIDTLIVLQQHGSGPPSRVPRIVDARTQAALADAWVLPDGFEPQRSDRAGLLVLPGQVDTLLVQRNGYVPRRVTTLPDVALTPLYAGVLLDTPIVLDAAGSGLEPTDTDWGVSGAQLAFDVVSRLAGRLEATGARVFVTRGAVQDVSEIDRIRLAGRSGARLLLRIEVSLGDSVATVLHYPDSRTGMALATALSLALQDRHLVDSVAVVADTQPILLQTPCPAVVVRLPGRVADGLATTPRLDSRLPQTVYALQLGVRRGLSAEDNAALEGRVVIRDTATGVADLVLLDRADLLEPDDDGRFRFDAVPAGQHELTVQQGTRIWRRWVWLEGSTEATIDLTLP